MSRCLAERSIDHVVLERGEVANSWRTERWDSLRLLTPNWQSRLPGYGYEGDDPDGFRTMPEIIAFIERYAQGDRGAGRDAHRRSLRSAQSDDGYVVATDQGDWHCRHGRAGHRRLQHRRGSRSSPAAVPPSIATAHADGLPQSRTSSTTGGVLVVGASATGTQIADEIHRSGRPVTLAVGEHVRVPRVYRGKDIQWWMDAAGVLDERYDEVDDIVRARKRAVAAARRLADAHDARSQCAHRHRREARRPPRRHRATARRSSPARCATCARWPISR